jgi:hypothetical protein
MDSAPFQFSLLAQPRRHLAPDATEQSKQIVRVEGRIAELVTAFLVARVGQEFRLVDLTEYVSRHVQVAPDSPRRVMSALAKSGQVDVRCISRSSSLWAVASVAGGSRVIDP